MIDDRHLLAPYLPGTSAYRKRRHAAITAAEKSLRRKFGFIEVQLADAERKLFGRYLRRAAIATMRFEAFARMANFALIAVGLASLFGVAEVLILAIPVPSHETNTWTDAQSQRMNALTIALAMTLILQLLSKRHAPVGTRSVNLLRLWVIATFVLGAFGTIGYLADVTHVTYSVEVIDFSVLRGLMLGFTAAALMLIALLAAIYILGAVFAMLRRIWGRSSPESRLIFLMSMAMHAIRGRKWRQLRFRHEAVEYLELAAYTFENYVPAVLKPSHYDTKQWLQQRCLEMAAKPRDLQRWLVSPHADTPTYLAGELSSLLICILKHDWSAITGPIHPQRASTPLSLRRGAQTVGVAVLPAVALFFFGRVGVLELPIASFVGVGAYLWAVAVMLFTIDPKFTERMAAVRDIKHIFGA